MSVQAMSFVIDHSRQKGGGLLCLLMIANHADRFGRNAFPGIGLLATECRMSERQIYNLIPVLEASGELRIERSAGGRGNTTVFQIVMGKGEIISGFIPVDNRDERVKSPPRNPELQFTERVKSSSKKGEISGGRNHTHKPSLTVNEPLRGSGTDVPDPVEKSTRKKSGRLSPMIAEVAERIFRSDPSRFRRLIVWIREKQSERYTEQMVADALSRFEAKLTDVAGEWWPYLEEVGKKVRTQYLQREASEHKGRIVGELGAALRGLIKPV